MVPIKYQNAKLSARKSSTYLFIAFYRWFVVLSIAAAAPGATCPSTDPDLFGSTFYSRPPTMLDPSVPLGDFPPLSSFRALTGPNMFTLAALLTSVAFRIVLCPCRLEMFCLLRKILSFLLSMKTLLD